MAMQQQQHHPMHQKPPPEAFGVFEGQEGQAPASIMAATGAVGGARMDPGITESLAMASNFTGHSSQASGVFMQEVFMQARSTYLLLNLLHF